jgi:hypothetical protein
MLLCGLILLVGVGRIAAYALPTLSDGIGMIVIFLAFVWSAVGLFMMAGELLTKWRESHGDDESI